MVYGVCMRIHRQDLDPTFAPITMEDRIFFTPDGELNLVLDDDIFDANFGLDNESWLE